MEVFFAVIGIFVAAGAGFYLGRTYSSDAQERARLEQEVKDKTNEINNYRQRVNTHFETTAELFNQVSDSYQILYEHMAQGASHLCASPSFRALPKANYQTSQKLADQSGGYDATEVFNPEKLYNAYEYKNHAEEESPVVEEEPIPELDATVETDDDSSPALDYAIKEKGVINHNSLNNDNVKTH